MAEQHRHTLMIGRTLMQQALPITFGLKAARWLSLVTRQTSALRAHRQHTLATQLGGAAGTLASLGSLGPRVAQLLAEELRLPLPELPWHTERDRVAEIAATLGIGRAHICGLSLGGIIAQWCAIYHPERVLSATLANTAAHIGSEAL